MAWWKKASISIGPFVIWFLGLVAFGSNGYESQYFWVSGVFVAVAFAVAPFWKLRRRSWYWPTIAFLVFANLMLLYSERNAVAQRALPAKGVIQLIFMIDGMISWAVMVGVCWLFSRVLPWQLTDEQ